MTNSIESILSANNYPGRGIIIGVSEDGAKSIVLYFIMGRSVNSRNRVFEKTEDGIQTKAHNPGLLADPSLVIYHPLRVFDGWVIVTNGDQTETISEYMQSGQGFRGALLTREFEPDPPIYTPRISGLVSPDGSYSLSILKTAGGDPSCCCRYFFEYSRPVAGHGHLISTYKADGSPPPSFEGEPVSVNISCKNGLFSLAGTVWNALNEENKVSLYARETVLATGESSDFIINKNAQV